MSDLLAHLGRASLAGGAFVAAVWLVCRALPRLSPAVRCGLWWTASLKLLIALAWVAPIELALLPSIGGASGPAEPSAVVATSAPAPEATVGTVPEAPPVAAAPLVADARPRSVVEVGPSAVASVPWSLLLALAWLGGVAFGAARLARDLAVVRRLRRASRPIDDPAVLARFERLRERLGIEREVDLRVADGIRGPLTLGLVRPAVLLPADGLDRLGGTELEMALCHELLHVRRRDLWAGWVPQLARRIFFFHPLAALAAREHALAREATCDAQVLAVLGAPPRSYGRLLLRWTRGAGTEAPLPEIAAAAGASSSFVHLKRRLEMLQRSSSDTRSMKLVGGALAVVALVALTPLRIVAQPPEPPAPPEAPIPPAPPEAAPVIAALPAPPAPPPARPVPAPSAVPAPHPAPPVAVLAAMPAPPAPPAPPVPPVPEHSGSYSYYWSNDDGGEGWALMGPDDNVWMQNARVDHDRLESLRRKGQSIVWFRRDGREYVIRDRATIERLEGILEPQRELGRMQGELGGKQGELGARQGELGGKQGELGAQQGQLGARQGELASNQARLAWVGDDEESADRRARRQELTEQQRELGRRQQELGERQRELAAKQRELAEKQRELGAEQRELGERQREAAERAQAQIRALFDQALADGTAEAI